MEKGFKLNPYDRFVINKLVNSKQCTLVWYVDNNKVSHMEAKVVQDLIRYLKNQFGELVLTRGKKHIFWGMNKNVTEEKKLRLR